MSKCLTQAAALFFRITHRDNVPWIISHGLHSESSDITDPNYVQIGNPDLIDKRRTRAVGDPYGGTLRDYVAFYFTPFSPMAYNIVTGWNGIQKRSREELVIIRSSLHRLRAAQQPFIFTDRHAYLATAQPSVDLADLDRIDWPILERRDFKRDPDDPGKLERYEAETLVHKHVPLEALLEIICYNDSTLASLREHLPEGGLAVPIVAKPKWYF